MAINRTAHEEDGYTTIGFSSILVIFVMLSLTTFTVLTLVSANADYKLSKRVAERTTDYYSADTRAEEKLALIDDALDKAYISYGRLDSGIVENALGSIEGLEISNEGMAVTDVTFSEKISDSQSLVVELFIPPDVMEGRGFYELAKWQVINTPTEAMTLEEDTLHLLGND